MNLKKHMGRYAAALACATLFGACLFQNHDQVANREGGGWDDFPNANENLCGDLSPIRWQTVAKLYRALQSSGRLPVSETKKDLGA